MYHKKLPIQLLLTVFCFSGSYTLGQQKELDSLLNVNSTYTKNDSVKLNILHDIVHHYTVTNPNKAIQYAQQEISVAQKLVGKKYLIQAYLDAGSAFESKSDFLNSLKCFQNVLNIYQHLGQKQGMAISFFRIGNIFFEVLDFPSAIIYYNKGLDIAKSINDSSSLVLCLRMLGWSYSKLSFCTKAVHCSREALLIQRKFNDKYGIAGALNVLGIVYKNCGNFKDALKCYQESMLAYDEVSRVEDIRGARNAVIGNISEAYKHLHNYNLALKYLNEALALNNSMKSSLGIASNYVDMSDIHLDQKHYALAINYALKAKVIADSIGALDNKQYALRNLNQAYAATGEYAKAYTYYKQYIAVKDSISSGETQKKITALQLRNDFNRQTDSIKSAERIKDDKARQQQAISKLKLQQQWIYSIGILILLALASSWFIYKNRLKQLRLKTELEKEKAEQEKKEAEFQRNLADVSLAALRSQMNPHFIFNCLNSIKLYTTQNDTVAATEYLTKFSKLIRQVMENSRNDKISLASELDALKLYIEMEAMRFKEKLRYSITVEKNVETDYIEIPPLLLQPYVENAIWHGLMHKEDGGKIDIRITTSEKDSLLQISITDDGIGRKKSAELKSKIVTVHKSYGMRVTAERITLINRIYKTGADIKVYDLTDDNGDATGTKVIIQIPI